MTFAKIYDSHFETTNELSSLCKKDRGVKYEKRRKSEESILF